MFKKINFSLLILAFVLPSFVLAEDLADICKKISEATPQVQKHLAGKQIVKFIYVPGKIINYVIN